ncbi:MAG: M67 family metallopeptidase [Actinomycetota bacterium]|nr:M67 family metallopeptidase [Actinomycetota bacterium]
MPAAVRRALDEHARAEAPNEACGLLALRDGVAERYLPGENLEASPYRFRLKPGSPSDLFLEDEGYELALFHSHVEAPARPSRTDVELSDLWPDRLWLILSLRTGDLAAWRIADGRLESEEVSEG